MSSSSVVGQAEHSVTHADDWTDPNKNPNNPGAWATPLVPLASMAYDKSQQSDVPNQAQAGAQPTRADATMTALNNQLNQEMSLRASRGSGYYSGTGGLLDSSPNSAGRVLLGGG